MPKDWGSHSPDTGPGDRLPGDRGASEIIGVVLLFGMVLAGIAVIALSGANAVDEVKDENDLESAAVSMEELRSEMGTLAYDNTSKRRFEFAAHNTERVGVEDDGYMAFSVNGVGTCTANRSMGMVKFQQDDGDLLAYEANAIWKKTDGEDTVMVAPPNFEYRNETIDGITYRTFNYPLVNVNASQSDFGRSSELTVEDVGDMRAEMERRMCLRGSNASVIDEVNNVTITITGSEFHDGWAEHFNETFEGQGVYHNPVNETVRVTLPLGKVPNNCSTKPPNVTFFADNGTEGDYVTVNKGETVFLFGSATDPCDADREMANTTMIFDDGSRANVTTTAYSWKTAGEKNVTFRAEDLDGDVAEETVTVKVNASGRVGGPAPGGPCSASDPTAGLVANNTSHEGTRVTVSTGEWVQFDGTSSDTDSCGPGSQIRDEEIFGPGFYEGDGDAQNKWHQPGLYTVTYVAWDNEGNRSSAQVVVEVTSPGGGPPGGGGPPDGDGDGVADSVDDCPSTPGAGENGCAPLSEEDDGLRVNQSSGTLTVLGSQVTKRNVSQGVVRKSRDVVFVLDGTGSMETNDPTEERVDATKSFVGRLNASAGDRAGWVEFRIIDSRCRYDEAYDECSTLHQGLTDDFDAVNDSVEGVNERGWTYIGSGIGKGVDELASTSNDKQIIVLLTDGRNDPYYGWDATEADLNSRTIDRAQEAAAQGITIYAVGLSDAADQDLLDDVARVTGGEDYQVDDADELEDVFGKIAGETAEPARRVEFMNTSTTINVRESSDPQNITLGDVNDPDGSGASRSIDQDDPEWLLSLEMAYNQCESGVTTGSPVEYDGETYNRTECQGTTPVDTVEGGDASHRIYLDGDEVPTFQGDADKPWKNSVGEIVRQHDADLVDGGEFDLGPNRAVIVTRFSPGNFTVTLFTADDTAPSNPSCVPTPPDGTLNVDPGLVVSKGTNVSLSGMATDTDTCGIGADITDESLTGEGPTGIAFTENDSDRDHTWNTPGRYEVTYEFEDNDGGSPYEVTKEVRVVGTRGCVDGDPTPSVNAPATVGVNEEVTVSGSATDGDACGPGIVNRTLTGDGLSTNGTSATVEWSSTGNKTVTYRVWDDEGNRESQTVEVRVVDRGSAGGSQTPDDSFVIGIGGDEVVIDVDGD